MATSIPARELRNHYARILERVRTGERITVVHDGRPVVDLVPHAPDELPPMFRPADDQRTWPAMTSAARRAWAADIRALEDVVDETIGDPWERG